MQNISAKEQYYAERLHAMAPASPHIKPIKIMRIKTLTIFMHSHFCIYVSDSHSNATAQRVLFQSISFSFGNQSRSSILLFNIFMLSILFRRWSSECASCIRTHTKLQLQTAQTLQFKYLFLFQLLFECAAYRRLSSKPPRTGSPNTSRIQFNTDSELAFNSFCTHEARQRKLQEFP